MPTSTRASGLRAKFLATPTLAGTAGIDESYFNIAHIGHLDLLHDSKLFDIRISVSLGICKQSGGNSPSSVLIPTTIMSLQDLYTDMIVPLIISAILTIGAIVATVLTVKALRRIARNHERSVALLEEIAQQQRSEHPDSATQDADTAGSP